MPLSQERQGTCPAPRVWQSPLQTRQKRRRASICSVVTPGGIFAVQNPRCQGSQAAGTSSQVVVSSTGRQWDLGYASNHSRDNSPRFWFFWERWCPPLHSLRSLLFGPACCPWGCRIPPPGLSARKRRRTGRWEGQGETSHPARPSQTAASETQPPQHMC